MVDGPQPEPDVADPAGDTGSPTPGGLGRLGAGVALMLLTVVIFGAARLVAGDHAYDPGATPPATVRLTQGKTYQLSTPVGVAALQKQGVLTSLACTWSADGQQQTPLAIVTTMTDPRNLRQFASVTGPVTGRVGIRCAGIDRVFVDDADGRGTDYSSILILLSIATGVAGVGLAVSGWYRIEPHPGDSGEVDQPAAVTEARPSPPV